MRKLWFALLTSATVVAGQAQPIAVDPQAVRFANTITVQDLREHLTVVASDSLEGRETGTPGQRLAADYLARQFASFGLVAPFPGSQQPYYQRFVLEKSTPGVVFLAAADRRFTYLNDFYLLDKCDVAEPRTVPVVLVGHGIDDDPYSDYADLDVRGKAVLILGGEPFAEGLSLISGDSIPSGWHQDWRRKAEAARRRGAVACLFAFEPDPINFQVVASNRRSVLSQPTLSLQRQGFGDFGVFAVSPRVAAYTAGTSPRRLFKSSIRRIERLKQRSNRKPRSVTYQAQRIRDTVSSENVLGIVEGTDLRDEFVVITAHYDHLGRRDSLIYNGADDDGSGTVAILEMAEAFARAKAAGFGPRRSVIFMAVSGEEKGLLGSQYYVSHPVAPLSQTVANLNIDMIGRLDEAHANDPNYVYLIGSDMLSTELHAISEAVNEAYSHLKLDYRFNGYDDPNRFYFRSDHYNFARNGVPVIFYFNGTHEDYHRPTDTIEKIHFGKLERIARLVFYTAWHIASHPHRPVLDVR